MNILGELLPTAWKRRYITRRVARAVSLRDEGRCAHCGAATQDIEFDHILAIVHGGTSIVTNVQLLCPPCNIQKGPPPWESHRIWEATHA